VEEFKGLPMPLSIKWVIKHGGLSDTQLNSRGDFD